MFINLYRLYYEQYRHTVHYFAHLHALSCQKGINQSGKIETREEYYQSEEYLNNEEYEYDPEDYDPNDWDEDEDLYEKYYGDDEDDSYEEVYKIINPEYINKEGE